MIIGVSGKAGSGKDTLFEELERLSTKVVNMKFSGALKRRAGDLLGVSPSLFEDQGFKASFISTSENMSVRDFLIKFGMLMREVNPLYWVDDAMEVAKANDDNAFIVFTDMRFPNELKAIKDAGGVTIRINRLDNDGVAHESDTALDDADFDHVIFNYGTLDQFRENCIQLAKRLGIE